MKEKAKIQMELDVNEVQRESLTKDKTALQIERKTLSDKIQIQEELASGRVDYFYRRWMVAHLELRSLKIVLAEKTEENEQLEIALINYRKIQDIVKKMKITTEG
jgi:hypothetical protein